MSSLKLKLAAGFICLVSWYHLPGYETASGEKYSPTVLAAAHMSLPFGTLVKLERLDNGLSVVVRINDRGPSIKGREFDLSLAAAKALKMVGAGIVKVKATIVQEGSHSK